MSKYLAVVLAALFCGTVAFADFDPATLEGKEVLKQGICDIQGKGELTAVTGTYICVVVAGDQDTVYLVLFDTNKGDMRYVVEFKKDGDTVRDTLVWRKEVPCEGVCA